ncbi:hypothetical protein AAG747_12630 [Rapidithrix thailandica]|uniref:Uncharacterized protein n=1 Tax=Rapidithrix thailandica TaxID=413964 RepID=A0AAW9S8L1_9BACT
MLLLHEVLPHVHHQHDHIVEATESFRHDNHHIDHHHHSDENNQEPEQDTFFDFLVKNHSHTKHTHQYTQATIKQLKSLKQLDYKVFGINDIWVWVLKARQTDEGLHRYVLFKNILPDNPYLYFHPHRGPPSLG